MICLARPVAHRLLMSAQLGLAPCGRLGVVTRLASSGCGRKGPQTIARRRRCRRAAV